MNRTPNAKSMAKSLRAELASRNVELTHGAALEIVARQFGLADWNTLAAKIAAEDAPAAFAFQSTSPILRIFDEAKAKEFYTGFLGFNLDWEHRFGENYPLYAQVSRAGLVLHLSEHHGDASPGSAVYVSMRGLREFHGSLAAQDYKHAKPGLEAQPWGLEMRITDPFNNSLRFGERT